MVQGLDIADFVGVVDARRSSDGPSPSEVLAGLGLALRAALGLGQLGARRIVLIVTPRDAGLARSWREDVRVGAEVQELEVAEGQAPWRSLTSHVDRRFVLCRYDWVLDPAILRELLGRPLPKLVGALARKGTRPVGALVGEPELLSRVHGEDLHGLASRKDIGVWDVGDRWAYAIDEPEGRRRALKALFDACRKPVDGVVSRHLNRHVSLFISRLLVNTPVTPNMMTVATFAVSVVAAGFALDGGYGTTLIAAALMQLNSILDGCDGELARVRFQGSKLGQWLDTIGDDASNVIFWVALAVGASKLPGIGSWLALAGWIAAVANAIAALQNYALLAKAGSGDFYVLSENDAPPPAGFIGAVVRFFSVILKQDFFLLLVLVMALLGWLHHGLVIVAIGAVITMINSTARTLRVWRDSRRRSMPE
jgi:phosphatidylglycerophosphate synthase